MIITFKKSSRSGRRDSQGEEGKGTEAKRVERILGMFEIRTGGRLLLVLVTRTSLQMFVFWAV